MRIIYFDIDSLRFDHLACNGYIRASSPNIDRIASEGVVFEGVYNSDSPCLPSRTAMWSGRFGIHTGVNDHLGASAYPFPEGGERKWRSEIAKTNWMTAMRSKGYRTVTVSPFAERHSAYHWDAGYAEIYNTAFQGEGGLEMAEDATDITVDWIKHHGQEDNWFLHVNYWDVHWPYRTPESYGNPFKDVPFPDWLSEEVIEQQRNSFGAKSAQDFAFRVRKKWEENFPRQPVEIRSIEDVVKMFDGYDTSIHYVDHHIGKIMDALDRYSIYDDTAIIIGSDHGEHLGELNMYMCHRIADNIATHLPYVIKWPGVEGGRRDSAFHYHFDIAATVLELINARVPSNWDAESFSDSFVNNRDTGRPYLVTTAGVGGLSRGVRFDRYMMTRMYHGGYNNLDSVLLFDVEKDPHQRCNLAWERKDLLGEAMIRLDEWHRNMMATSRTGIDPLWITMAEGGPQDMRGKRGEYEEHLRATGRGHYIDDLLADDRTGQIVP